MSKKEKSKKPKTQYKLVVFNESTLQELIGVRISRWGVITILSMIVFISFAIMASIIIFTPIKQLLPGYGDYSSREMAIESAEKIDSLQNEVALSTIQLNILKSVILGDIKPDSIPQRDSLKITMPENIDMDPTQRESDYVAEYEENNAYNVGTDIRNEALTSTRILIPPVQGTIIESFAPDSNRIGVKLAGKPSSPILAVDKGSIIYSSYNQKSGYTIVVQHENNLISVYKEIGKPLCNVGHHLKKGEPIAFTGWTEQLSDKSDNSPMLIFELWQDGVPINPTEKIVF